MDYRGPRTGLLPLPATRTSPLPTLPTSSAPEYYYAALSCQSLNDHVPELSETYSISQHQLQRLRRRDRAI
jgi:hypothetical protein